MTAFSFERALGEPFGLIKDRPLWPLIWGLPMVLTLLLMIPPYMAIMADMPLDPGAPPPETTDLAGLLLWNLAIIGLSLLQVAATLVIYAGIVRAVLAQRAPDRWAHMRLGMDEVWLLILGILMVVAFYAAAIVALLIGALLFAAPLAQQTFGPIHLIGVALLVLVGVFGLLVAAARVSLMVPATVHHHKLALAEGWGAAKGRLWPLVGLMALVWVIYLVIYTVLVVAFVVVVVAIVMATDADASAQAAETFGEVMPSVPVALAIGLVVSIPLAWMYGALMALFIAPFAHAYRQIVTPEAPTVRDDMASNI